MEITRLDEDVISKIRSSFNINSVAQCVFELVCNSLDAKSTSVAVRINLITFKIQVADNGDGITKENLELLGIRYMTNKCHHLGELQKHLSTYGYRGEALASIVEMCHRISISSRYKNTSETYGKTLTKDFRSDVKLKKHRASVGTTVTVLGFSSNFPVRQQRVIKEIELEEVKKYMESLVIINPGTSFSLRNDVTGLLLLNSPKNSDIIGSFCHLHPEITDSFVLLKVTKNKVTTDALIHKEFILSNKFQFVYVNKRPVLSQKIQKNVNKSFYKKMQLKTKRKKNPLYETKRYPIYVLNIRCPQSFVDIPSKNEVEFKCWEVVLACIEKIIKTFFGLDDSKELKQPFERKDNANMRCGTSQVRGAVQACAFKRKSNEAKSNDENNFRENTDGNFGQNMGENTSVGAKKSKIMHLEEKKTSNSNKDSKNKQLPTFVRDRTTVLSSDSGNYEIDDSGKQKQFKKSKKLKSIIKKPLPIRIESGIFDLASKIDADPNFDIETGVEKKQFKEFDKNLCRMEKPLHDKDVMPRYSFDQKSVYSGLNSDEDRGKNLILDMFLKSTQVFTGQDGESNIGDDQFKNVSSDTIEETNYVMENKIEDNIRRINTTMSISVNVKKKRMNNFNSKVSKCVQTSVIEDRLDMLTSKCIQTSQKPTLKRVRSNLSDLTQKFDEFKLSHEINEEDKDNYTILINTVRKRREFKFVKKSEELETYDNEKESFKPLKICRCRSEDENFFKFDKSGKLQVLGLKNEQNNLEKEDNLFAKPCKEGINIIKDEQNFEKSHVIDKNNFIVIKEPKPPTVMKKQLTFQDSILKSKIRRNNLNFRGVKRQSAPGIGKNINICDRSPYFAQNGVQRMDFMDTNLERKAMHSTYDDFQPRFKSTQFRQSRFQNTEYGDNLGTNNVVSSPYFPKNYAKNDVSVQKNVFLPQRQKRYEDDCVLLQNNSHPIQNRLLEGIKRGCTDLESLRRQNAETNSEFHNRWDIGHTYNNYGHSNTNFLPYYHYYGNCGLPDVFPRPIQPILLPRNYANTFDEYNQQFRGNIWPRNQDLVINNNNRNIYLETDLMHPKKRKIDEDLHMEISQAEPKQMVSVCKKCNHENINLIHENNHTTPKNLRDSQSEKSINKREFNLSMEEGPAWYTPNVSDENMYHEAILCEPKENRNDHEVVADILNKSENESASQVSKKKQKIGEKKETFNFKFSWTPDIFSSDIHCGSKRSPKEADENNEGFETKVVKNNVNLNDFFDLPSFGILNTKVANRTTNTVCQSLNDSILEITLPDDQEKKHIIDNELAEEKKNIMNGVLSCEAEVRMEEVKENKIKFDEKSRIIMDSQNEWLRKYNEVGKGFYVNKRTGLVTTFTPKYDEGTFCFAKRLEFVPKGRSPVLNEHKKIDISLSQGAKSKLQEFILESYDNELMVIKWQNFIYDDPKTFFEEIYKEKTKQFENVVPCIQDNTLINKTLKDSVGFNKNMFGSLEVIGQVDRKFIAVLDKTKQLLLLFDQHAVHERIRVEQFLREYKGVKARCKQKITIFMPRNDLSLLKTHSAYIGSLGLNVEFFKDCLNILDIPLCIQEKFNSQDNTEDLSKIVNILVKEILESLKVTRGSTSQLPKIIHNVINLKACRGAVKFGDALTKEECITLLKDLAKCNLPFQCAHGRPTLTPLLTLSKLELQKKTKKLNLKKVLRVT